MSEEIIIRRATLEDIDFLVDTIVAAEKSGTYNFGLAKLFELSEEEMRACIKAMLDEEIEGCEFSVSSFMVAEDNGQVVSAFAGWVEGRNEDELPSAILKSNLVGYCLPVDNVKRSQKNIYRFYSVFGVEFPGAPVKNVYFLLCNKNRRYSPTYSSRSSRRYL